MNATPSDRSVEDQGKPHSDERPPRRGSSAVPAAAPLFPAAVGLLSGIALDRRLEPEPWWWGIVLVLATGAAVSRKRNGFIAAVLIGCTASAAGGLAHWSRARVVAASSIERYADSSGRIARIRGRVASEPRLVERRDGPFARWRYQGDETAFLLSAREVEHDDGWSRASGVVRISTREAVFDLREGERVEAFGRLTALAPPMNPGAFDWRDYYRRQGVIARMYCDHRENIRRLDEAGSPSEPALGWFRRAARGLLTDDIVVAAPEEASFLEAMVLGHRSRFDRRLDEVFTRAGCIHFIAVSGANIVILIGAVWFVGRALGVSRRRAALFMAATVVAYTALAEPRPPVLRACVMGLLFCAALLLRRGSAHFNWICAAAILLCVVDPTVVFDVGFQLSFAAVLGVAYLSRALLNGCCEGYWWFRRSALGDSFAREDAWLAEIAALDSAGGQRSGWEREWSRVGRFTATAVAVSAGAWLCGTPITATTFGQIQWWGVPNTLIVYPLMSAVMIVGLLKIGVAMVSPTLEAALSWVLTRVDRLMIGIVERLAELPGASVVTEAPPWWLLTAYYVFLVLFVIRFGRSAEASTVASGTGSQEAASESAGVCEAIVRRGWPAALIGLIGCAVAWSIPSRAGEAVTVTVLAVGSGSATVIELPDGSAMLYDAGTTGGSDVGASVVVPFLRSRGIRQLERIVVSHADLDHYGGVPTVVEQIATSSAVLSRCFAASAGTRSAARHFLDLLGGGGLPIEVVDDESPAWERSGVTIQVLWPPASRCAALSSNDSSLVMKLRFAGRSILLTGDIEDAAQRSLMERGGLDADVLVLPHHGSVRPTTGRFLETVGARHYVRSSGQRMARTDNGLAELCAGVPLHNTADVGAVRIVMDAEGVRVTPFRQ